MDQTARTDEARALMDKFAVRTGVEADARRPQRYLWTDAFAVCNDLALHERTGERRFLDRALALVEQVHGVLGRHREDDPRAGWLSGLPEDEGAAHPTAAGLRIGKADNERGPDEPYDPRAEWDRDGQYFHYLTRWMHALTRIAAVTDEDVFTRWAAELAEAAHEGFTYAPRAGATKRMYWKMSVDLSRPLVPSMGHHDPLDGLVSYLEVQAVGVAIGDGRGTNSLREQIAEMQTICRSREWGTDDALGLGGLLMDALRMAQLAERGAFEDAGLFENVLDAAAAGLSSFVAQGTLRLPAARRLAFRELGLAIGLEAAARLRDHLAAGKAPVLVQDTDAKDLVDEVVAQAPLGESIVRYWLQPAHRKSRPWRDHLDINAVMLATALVPEGYLG